MRIYKISLKLIKYKSISTTVLPYVYLQIFMNLIIIQQYIYNCIAG